MIAFWPEITQDGYRRLVTPITPKHATIVGYNPANVVELLASLWAYPHKEHDACRLLDGKEAEIVYHRPPDKNSMLPHLRASRSRFAYLWEPVDRGRRDVVRYLHGCDIMCYSPGNRRLLIEMFQRDRCFLSLDPISLVQCHACMADNDYEGLFVVHQLHARQFPEWSEDVWKSFGCQARPHIQFQFP